MPSFVVDRRPKAEVEERAAAGIPELVARNCTLKKYQKKAVPAFDVNDEIVAYASPDSTFAVTKSFIDDAKKSIVIGIYDFTADHIKQLVLQAMRRNVKVTLMLDIDSGGEQKVFDDLAQFGAKCVEAPSCASKRARFFSSSHEKVIVIDGEWSLVQSGNYSDNSIPLNVEDGGDPDHFVTGNRDTGLAIRSTKLAKFFTDILNSDMKLELSASGPEIASVPEEALFVVEAAPKKIPDKLFPSMRIKLQKPLRIQPVLSPDNYMDVVPDLIRKAKKSVLIEQQYIRGSQDKIVALLTALADARKASPKLDIRIILGKIFGAAEAAQEKVNQANLKMNFGLDLGTNVRFIDTSRLVHCHNKMVLIDGTGVLVSSQNWSNSAVSLNREAGVWLEHLGICKYFTGIFENDWSTALKKIPAAGPAAIGPETLQSGGFIRVEAGDYREV